MSCWPRRHPRDPPAATDRLMQDPDLRAALIAQGRDWVMSRHGRAYLDAAVAADMTDLLGASPRR